MTRIRRSGWALLAALMMLATTAHADDAAVRATLQRLIPGEPVQSLQPAAGGGLVEAVVGGQIYYLTADGRYLLAGPLIDTAKRVNLTEARLQKLNASPWDTLPLELAFKRVKGKGTRRIAIFEDPDCPYWKVLERTLETMDDLTIYVLLFPIDNLHPQAAAKSRAVWCAKDRAAAWETVMRTGTVPAAPDCKDPIAAIGEFAKRRGINGTPTAVLSDGRRLVGAVPRAQLERELQQAQGR